jgi:hypothetical protein
MPSRQTRKYFGLTLLPVLALGACSIAPPSGPTVVAMPGQGKNLAQFQKDDNTCRAYAQSKMTDSGQVAANAHNNAAVTAVAGTLIGAAVGAGLGSLGGNIGAGAAVGAGAGLLGGSAVAGGNTQAAADSLQGRYDVAYAQCMVANGDTIQQPQGPVVYAAPPPAYYGPPPVVFGPGPVVVYGPPY